jgi:hypothetical protein
MDWVLSSALFKKPKQNFLSTMVLANANFAMALFNRVTGFWNHQVQNKK